MFKYICQIYLLYLVHGTLNKRPHSRAARKENGEPSRVKQENKGDIQKVRSQKIRSLQK